MTSRENILRKIRALKPLLEAEGVAHMTLFGSQARETATDESDIDIAIEVAPKSKFSMLNLVGVEQLVAEATGFPANAFMKLALDKGFIEQIENDGIRVF